MPGIVLPSFFVVRMGNQMLFSSEKQQLLIPAEDGHHILSQVGDIIYRWMRPFADDGTQALLDAWENRESCVRDIIIPRMHLLARMSKDDFQMLSQRIGSQWNNSWSGSIMQEGEMFAAARMSAGFVSMPYYCALPQRQKNLIELVKNLRLRLLGCRRLAGKRKLMSKVMLLQRT